MVVINPFNISCRLPQKLRHSRRNQHHILVMLSSNGIKNFEPILIRGQINKHVEGLLQGKPQLCAFQFQVRKHVSHQLAFFFVCRTLKDVVCFGGYNPLNERLKKQYEDTLLHENYRDKSTANAVWKAINFFEDFTGKADFTTFDAEQAKAFKRWVVKQENGKG